MKLVNREGLAAFDCEPDHGNRKPGLSAMLRVHNEEAWIEAALDSVLPWVDEAVVVLNLCTDQTAAIVNRVQRRNRPGAVRVFDYPFKLHPMGPGHDDCPAESVHACAYYYNFAQAKTRYSHVMKWDGDMVAMDWLGDEIKEIIEDGHDRIKFEGRDIVGDDLTMIGCHPCCPTNGIYKVREGVHYAQGQMTQNLRGVPDSLGGLIEHPAFLHFKWARKSFASATVQWPLTWWKIPHFQRIAERRHPVECYTGEYPASVAAMLVDESLKGLRLHSAGQTKSDGLGFLMGE